MQVMNERKSLRLIKSAEINKDSVKLDRSKTSIGSEEYYKQVEHYAQQIRHTSDVDEIINILDLVLSETRGLDLSDEINFAQEQVQVAEKKIELLKNEMEQLRELVHTDQMTGAFNRRGLEEIFIREAARADRKELSLCVVLLDLDNFKKINDTCGHQFGDIVLAHVVNVAKETLRPSDIIARFGGEEFVILLSDITMEAAVSVISRLQKELAKQYLLQPDNQLLSPTFSAGVAIRRFGEHQNSVIKRADDALY
nr:GGDEF domain-containing protein [Nitrosomonas sp.]